MGHCVVLSWLLVLEMLSGILATSHCPGEMTSAGCFVIDVTFKTQQEALNECSQLGLLIGGVGSSTLASPATLPRELALNGVLQRHHDQQATDALLFDAAEFWLGGFESTDGQDGSAGKPYLPVWRTLKDSKVVSHQGCFTDFEPGFLQLAHRVPLSFPAAPADCISECLQLGYTYAGLQRNTDRNDPVEFKCSCGAKYGRYGYGSRADCVFKCGTDNYRCGGDYVKDVYVTDGNYVNWAFSQPNNQAVDSDYQACGALEGRNNWKMGDETCSTPHYYICEIDDASCNTNARYQRLSATKCAYHETGKLLSWFDARLSCKTMGGDLLSVLNDAEWQQLVTKLQELRPPHVNREAGFMWIGLVGKIWSWADGSEFLYTNWDGVQPDQIKEHCMSYRYRPRTSDAGSYVWQDQDCTKRLPFVCQVGEADTTAAPHTTPHRQSPRSESTASDSTTAVEPTFGSATPSIGALTGLTGLSDTEIVLLAVLGAVLLLVLIFIICCCCYYKKTRKSRTAVHPQKGSLDLRNQALVPYGDYYGNNYPASYSNGLYSDAPLNSDGLALKASRLNLGSDDDTPRNTQHNPNSLTTSQFAVQIPYNLGTRATGQADAGAGGKKSKRKEKYTENIYETIQEPHTMPPIVLN